MTKPFLAVQIYAKSENKKKPTDIGGSRVVLGTPKLYTSAHHFSGTAKTKNAIVG